MDDTTRIALLELALQAARQNRNAALDQAENVLAELSYDRAKAAQDKAAEPVKVRRTRKVKADS
jgi:hypothetical protein